MFAEQIDGSAFCIANEEYPTRITANCRSSPDVNILSSVLIAYTTWGSHIALNSDQLPLIIKVDKSSDFITSEERTFINFKKAEWDMFRDMCEAQFSQLPAPENTYAGEKAFSDILLQAAKRCIPAGVLPRYVPTSLVKRPK